MNWVFLDAAPLDYDVATPLERPLGGSQSALCYLATALARRGERVTTLTALSKPREIDGVHCLLHESIPAEIFAPADTITVVLNGPADIAQIVRDTIPRGRRLVLWTQHSHTESAMSGLRQPDCLAQWDRVVCISDWQQRMYQDQLGVPREKIDVLRNACGPPFQNLFADPESLAAAKAKTPRLVYTSTPFRGLDVLVACFPALRRRNRECTLDVYSSMQLYGRSVGDDPYQRLYDQCRTLAGVHYRGVVSQMQLARELAPLTILAYPSTFAETGCIAVMEALAAGLLVVTSDLGALPETCGGWARLVPAAAGGRPVEQFAIDFARAVDQAIGEFQTDRAAFWQQRYEQSRAINADYTWDLRAAQWQQAAARWLGN
jgi:glycosyltransferase involved in cell wall biosynthesis